MEKKFEVFGVKWPDNNKQELIIYNIMTKTLTLTSIFNALSIAVVSAIYPANTGEKNNNNWVSYW